MDSLVAPRAKGDLIAMYKVGVIGLRMGSAWSLAAAEGPDTILAAVYDSDLERCKGIADQFSVWAARTEDEFFNAGIDITVIATPDHLHVEQSKNALEGGSHVICEKPLAPTVADCLEIIRAVRKSGKYFMVGQVCRYAPGFRVAKKLIEDGEIGEIAFIESEYAHDYTYAPGVNNWRKDPKIKREGFVGGGCHTLDIIRWFAGDPEEVFCYSNRKLLEDWPTDDTGVAVCRLPGGVIGKVFVSVGAKRRYTMRTVIYGRKGTIICDNTSPAIKLYRNDYFALAGVNDFWEIPVNIASHNVSAELKEFIDCLKIGKQSPTDVHEGTKTVAFGEAALESARTGKPIRIAYDW